MLSNLNLPTDPNLLVGLETSDDAAVYRLSDDIAMISTVDFITPPVDDPYWFGQIAAANALSDIYAMGGKPVSALNLVMFPSKILDLGLLREIIQGGSDKVIESGACLAGGHSVDDEEPKYGLCVNGVVHPDRVITNAGCEVGDALILTKPLGTGVLFNAVRSGKLSYKDLERDVLPTVAMLNDTAIDVAKSFEIHACTDVTGFGLAGHLQEMAIARQARLRIVFSNLHFYPYAHDMYQKGETTGSNGANRLLVQDHLQIRSPISETEVELIFDPQTSGGLLFSVPSSQADPLLSALSDAGLHTAYPVGDVIEGPVGVAVV
jgi:selenide, water dikinase